MAWPLALLGLAVVGVALFDMLWTTVAATAGGGPVTSRVSNVLWRWARRACLRSRRAHARMRAAGVVVVLSVFLTWLGATVLGWWLVLVPVTGAVTDRRTLALEIASLGEDAVDVVCDGAADGDWRALEQHLAAFAQPLHRTGQRHLAYPVLHHFHDTEAHAALAPRVAVLDDALLLLSEGVHPDHRPDPLPLRVTAAGVTSLLQTLASAHIRPADRPPPAPDLARLRAAGIPTVDDATFAAAVEARAERRRLLAGFVHDDGWTWGAVG